MTDLLRRRPFAAALAAAIAAHAAVLAWDPGRAPTAPHVGGSTLLEMRLTAPVEAAATSIRRASFERTIPHPAPDSTKASGQPTAGVDAGRSRGGASAPPGEPVYLPRSRLTKAPKPLDQVVVPFPDIEGHVHLRVRVVLYIEATGAVHRVGIETPGIAPAFAEAVQAAFAQARFTAGELDGVPVASQVRLEVEFGDSDSR